MNQHFDQAFHHADNAFAEANRAFAEADKAFSAMESEPIYASKDKAVHTVNFQANTWSKRWKLFGQFAGMAVSAVWNGRATMRFRSR